MVNAMEELVYNRMDGVRDEIRAVIIESQQLKSDLKTFVLANVLSPSTPRPQPSPNAKFF